MLARLGSLHFTREEGNKEGQFYKNMQGFVFPRTLITFWCSHPSLWRPILVAIFSMVVVGPSLPGHHPSTTFPEIPNLINVSWLYETLHLLQDFTLHFVTHLRWITRQSLWLRRRLTYEGFNALAGGWWEVGKREVGDKWRAMFKGEQVVRSSQFFVEYSSLWQVLFPYSTFQLLQLW